MPTKFGITYEVVDVDNPGTFTFKADGSDTTATAVMTDGTQNITLNFNNTTSGDPDTVFNTETSVFQYFEDDYLENNPATIDGIIVSYVGLFYRDTGDDGQNTQDVPFQFGTRFSRSDIRFDSTSVRFSRRTT